MNDDLMKRSVELIKELTTEIESMRPDYEFAQVVKQDEKTYSLKETADILEEQLKLGRNDLFEYLREKNILSKNKSNWNLPFRNYIDLGYFSVKVKNTNVGVKSVVFVTIKGLEWILKLWRKDNE
jgi:phage antirepressor YoqD-like protein